MKFRMNILLSVVLHVTIIALAFAVNLSDITYRVPTDYIFVSIFKEVTDVTKTISQDTKKHRKNIPSRLSSLNRDEIVNDRVYKDKASTVPTRNDNMFLDETSTLPSNERYKKYAVTTGLTHERSRSSELTAKSFSGKPIQGGDTGYNPLSLELIRTAIEKAKSYPLLARKKKIEGTVLVSFRIDKNGLPQGIKIIRSSGYHILDEEVSKIIKRAAPFPEVNHEIVAPITFKLTEPQVNR
ncbi:MAG: energy transducer TonB [Nitrospirota bacterium]|nr:energy transducer TonB [Nitrospirota bacterium]